MIICATTSDNNAGFVMTCFSVKDLNELLKQCYTAMKPILVTYKQLETHVCLLNTVDTLALALNHQTI